jgi:AsmA protein
MRWILKIALVLLVLVVIAVGALFLIPTDRIARLAEEQFAENTGRQLTLSGEVSPQLFPRLGVSLEGVAISNADWSDQGPMLEADALNVGVGLMALISGDIVVEAAEITNPVIRLEKNAQGVANWDFISDLGGEDDGAQASNKSISLPKATVTGGRVIYTDAQAGTSYELTDLDANLALPDLNATGEASLSARMNGQPFAVSGTLNGVQQLLDGGVQGVDLNFTAGASEVKFTGNAGMDPVQAKGTINADIADQKALFALLGQTPPVIPPGLGQQASLSADLTFKDNAIFLRGAKIGLDQNALAGDMDVVLSEPPRVKARLSAGSLDFSAMSTDSSSGDGAANVESGGWSTAPIDVSGLNAVNGDFTLNADAIDLGSIQLGKTALTGTLDNSRLVLDLKDIAVFDGLVNGQFVVNGRGGLSVRGDMAANNVAMQRLLADFAGYDRLVADAQLGVNFLASGGTMDALMKSLSGEGAMNVGSGEILGLDIAGMIRNLDASFQGEGSKTVFDDMTASFTIAGGVLTNNDLNFVSPLLTAKGEGQLNIGAQTINYRLDPTALAAQLDSGIRVPVLITGPWSDIKYRPDLKALIDTELEAEKAKLKEAAKAKEAELKAKAAEKLGVTVEEGQSTEDAIKDNLEDKAKNALRKLFE